MNLQSLDMKIAHQSKVLRMVVAITFLIALGGTGLCSDLTAYYVAESGDNSNCGDRSHPLRSIQEALDRMTEDGNCIDTVYISPGTYRETVSTTESGTADSPKVILALKGGDVVISACDPVNKWSRYRKGIYQAEMTSSVSQVFAFKSSYDFAQEPGMDPQEIMVEARWPNKPDNTAYGIFYNIDDGGVNEVEFDPEDPHRIYVSGLPRGKYSGAKLFTQGASRWWSRTANISKDHGGGSLETDDISTQGGFDELTGMKGYICGPLHLLEAPREWSWQSGTLYFIAPENEHPSSLQVEAKVRPYVIHSDFDHIQFIGIKTFGGAIRLAGQFNVLREMDCRYLSHHETWVFGDMDTNVKKNPQVGVAIAGDHSTIESCSLYYSGGSGISLSASHVLIENNLLKYTNYLGHFAHSIELRGEQSTIIGNELHHTGKEHIRIYGGSMGEGARQFRILYNNMSHNAYTNWDVGAITMWGVDADGGEIAYNWISESVESGSHWLFGIYFDNNNREFLVHHNVIWNISGNPIRFNSPSDELYVYNNTFGACRENIGGGIYYNPEIRGVAEDHIELTFVNNYHAEAFDFPEKYLPLITANNNFQGENPDDFLDYNFNKSAKEDSSLKDKGIKRSENVVFSSGVSLLSPTKTVDGKPDIGAYEFGGVDWRPGIDRKEDKDD